MLHSVLRDAAIPETFREELRTKFQTSARNSLALSAELVRLAALFKAQGVPFVALKGPMLSQYLYGALGMRTSSDIDVLVHREDVPGIRKILVSSGYQLKTTLHWTSDSACLGAREEEMSFESPSGVSIDVHWRLMPRYSASAFDNLSGWESLRTVPLAGHEIQILAPEPLLLFLCAHGVKHMFERLGWICDIARFLQLRLGAIQEQSRRAAALRQLSLGLHLARELLGVTVPEIQEDPEVESLARTVSNRLLAGAVPPVPAAEPTRYTLRLLETRAQRRQCLTGLYLTPSEAEYPRRPRVWRDVSRGKNKGSGHCPPSPRRSS